MITIYSTLESRKHVRVTPIGDQDVVLDVGRPGCPAVSLAAIRIPVAELRAALDADAPAGSDTRTDDDGLTLRLAQQQRDQATERAEKAEQGRDAYRHDARAAESALSRVRAALGLPDDATTDDMEEAAEQPRPLTPDDITDEMIQRAKRRFEDLDGALVCAGSDWVFWQVLAAALTEPPRPEGAERWEDFLIDALDYQALTDQQITDLADRIAEEMNR